MNLWIGTSGFQYEEWKGAFYPADLPVSKMLTYYSKRFSSAEVNYTFRRMPSAAAIAKWKSLTPDEFRFSLKTPQKVSHFAKLRDCGETMARFYSVSRGLAGKLGPVLVQLPHTLTKDAALLESFLESLPKAMRVAFEFRDASWFDKETYKILRSHNAALCIAENEELATPIVATADFGYLRLRRLDYVGIDFRHWAEFLGKQRKKWSDAFVYFKHEATCVGPKFAKRLIKLMKK